MKNKAIVQTQVISLRNLENRIGQLVIALSDRPQGSLFSITEDLRGEGKEQYKVINLSFGKDIHILIGVPKRRVQFVST